MTNAEINEARRRSRILENEPIIDKWIEMDDPFRWKELAFQGAKAYGEALFHIADLKAENERLKAENESLKAQVKQLKGDKRLLLDIIKVSEQEPEDDIQIAGEEKIN